MFLIHSSRLLNPIPIQISFTLFVTCAITGVHYGTGRHHSDLSDDDFETAMKVGGIIPLSSQHNGKLTFNLVLVALLHLVLRFHDHLQTLHRRFPTSHHGSTHPPLHSLPGHVLLGPHRPRLFLCHSVPVPPHHLLLGQGWKGGKLRRRGHHRRPDVPVQRHQRDCRLHFCSAAATHD